MAASAGVAAIAQLGRRATARRCLITSEYRDRRMMPDAARRSD
jgi:hypothetical protein